jgi:hypothetical protein
MNRGTKFEDRASSSRGKHEGESSANLCDRLCRTRDTSQRQLPTDQDYAASTREYQTDQSSPKTAPAVACPVFDKRNKQRQRQNQPHRLRGIDRSLHIRLGAATGGGWGACRHELAKDEVLFRHLRSSWEAAQEPQRKNHKMCNRCVGGMCKRCRFRWFVNKLN